MPIGGISLCRGCTQPRAHHPSWFVYTIIWFPISVTIWRSTLLYGEFPSALSLPPTDHAHDQLRIVTCVIVILFVHCLYFLRLWKLGKVNHRTMLLPRLSTRSVNIRDGMTKISLVLTHHFGDWYIYYCFLSLQSYSFACIKCRSVFVTRSQ